MNKFLEIFAKMNALVKRNPMLVFFFAMQMYLQWQTTGHFLQLNGFLSAVAMSFALALAHIIPAYCVYVIGDGTGLAKAPGLKYKLEFMFLGELLALILSLTFTYGILGVACQPFLSMVVDPSIASAGLAGFFASALGSLLDVSCVAVIFAQGGLNDE